MSETIVQRLLSVLGRALQTLTDASQELATTRAVIEEAGWDPGLMPNVATLPDSGAWAVVSQAVQELETGAAQEPPSLATFLELLTLAGEISGALEQVATTAVSGSQGNASELAGDLLTSRVIQELERVAAPAARAVTLLGVIETTEPDGAATGPRGRVAHARFRADNLVAMLQDPVAYLRTRYATLAGSGEVAKDLSALLLPPLRDLLRTLRLLARDGTDPQFKPILTPEQEELANYLFRIELPFDATDFGLTLCLAVDEGDLTILAVPTGSLQVTASQNGWTTEIDGDLVPSGIVVNRRGLQAVSDGVRATLRGSLSAPPDPLVLLGGTQGTRLAVAGLRLEADAQLDATSVSYGLLLGVHHATLAVDATDGDGFLGNVLPSVIKTDFDLGLGWSNQRGLYLRGGDGLELSLPVHRTYLDTVRIETVDLALVGRDGTIEALAAVTVAVNLGPVQASVSRLGLRAEATFPNGGGNLGLADLAVSFRPPDGVGLSIDAGAITGGGFLQRDAGPPERFAGALALRLTRFAVVAFGVFERTPSGAIAFVMVLGIRFMPAFQLGFGFSLTGIGGLVGINRRADIDALRERLVSGAASNVLFAEDPIRNAPTLLGDLRAFFPTADGVFVVGPTFQIGWFALARFDLGVIVELPGPSKIVLLGSARLQIGGEGGLPPLVQIRLDVVGVIDFIKQLVAFDAVLVNSRLLQIFHLTGTAAFRLSTGDRPYVLLTIGGFHPAFNPEPVALPPQNRVALTYDTGGSVRLSVRLEAYLAVTSNTFQTGAALEVGVMAGPLNALGFLGFNALIQFDPFYFTIDFAAGFRVRFGSITLAGVSFAGMLSGPGPLVLSGTFCIEILFFKICWSGSFALGQDSGDGLQPIPSLVQALTPELERRENLEASGGEDREVAVAPSRVAPSALVAPQGQLIWRQKRTPLNVSVERLEGVPLSRPQAVVAESGAARESMQEWFSPGTFINLSESEALNRAAFERLDAGIRLGFGLNSSGVVPHAFDIETIRLPEEIPLAQAPSAIVLPSVLQDAIEDRQGPGRVLEATPVIGVYDERWAVRDRTGGVLLWNLSQTDAHQRARQWGATATPAREAFSSEAIDLGGI